MWRKSTFYGTFPYFSPFVSPFTEISFTIFEIYLFKISKFQMAIYTSILVVWTPFCFQTIANKLQFQKTAQQSTRFRPFLKYWNLMRRGICGTRVSPSRWKGYQTRKIVKETWENSTPIRFTNATFHRNSENVTKSHILGEISIFSTIC